MSGSNVIPNNILNDLCTRFIINIPDSESQDVIRVFFQVELAHWFYLDFHCPENTSLKPFGLKEFASQLFNYCPTLKKFNDNFEQVFESWKDYKQAVPTYGAILLDPTLQFCLLVQGFWVKSSWGFAKGKVNQDEPPLECAIREVLEETGLDIRKLIDPGNFLEYKVNEQTCRLYVVAGVSMDTKFEPKTRQEIKSFSWFRVDHLPTHKKDISCKHHLNMNANAFFMVIPFVKELKFRIIQMQQMQQQQQQQHQQQQHLPMNSTPIQNKPSHFHYKQLHNIELSQTPIAALHQQKQQQYKQKEEFFESLLKSSEKNRDSRTKSESPASSSTPLHHQPTYHHGNQPSHHYGNLPSHSHSSATLTMTSSSSLKPKPHPLTTKTTNALPLLPTPSSSSSSSAAKQLVFPVKILKRNDGAHQPITNCQPSSNINKGNSGYVLKSIICKDQSGSMLNGSAAEQGLKVTSSSTTSSATSTTKDHKSTTLRTNNSTTTSTSTHNSATTTTTTSTTPKRFIATSATTPTTTTMCANATPASRSTPTTTTSTMLSTFDFKSPAWSNFKLDVEQLLTSMCS